METPSISALAHCETNGNLLGITVSNDEFLHEKLGNWFIIFFIISAYFYFESIIVNASITYSKNFTLHNTDGENFISRLSHKAELQVKNQQNAFLDDFGDIKGN